MSFKLLEIFLLQRRFFRVLVFFIQRLLKRANFLDRFNRIRLREGDDAVEGEKKKDDYFHRGEYLIEGKNTNTINFTDRFSMSSLTRILQVHEMRTRAGTHRSHARRAAGAIVPRPARRQGRPCLSTKALNVNR